VSLRRHILLLVAVDAVACQEFVRAYRLLPVRNGAVTVGASANFLILVDAPEDPLMWGVYAVLGYLGPQIVVARQAVCVSVLVCARVGDKALVGRIDVLRCAYAIVTGYAPQPTVETHHATLVQEHTLNGRLICPSVTERHLAGVALAAAT
jgi:hypothetical protein